MTGSRDGQCAEEDLRGEQASKGDTRESCILVTALGRIDGLFDCRRLGLDPFRLTRAE